MKHPKFCILSFLWECNDIEDKLNGVERKWPGHESTYVDTVVEPYVWTFVFIYIIIIKTTWGGISK